jgi:hypothetical protein
MKSIIEKINAELRELETDIEKLFHYDLDPKQKAHLNEVYAAHVRLCSAFTWFRAK